MSLGQLFYKKLSVLKLSLKLIIKVSKSTLQLYTFNANFSYENSEHNMKFKFTGKEL
jgi:hypothetical protein